MQGQQKFSRIHEPYQITISFFPWNDQLLFEVQQIQKNNFPKGRMSLNLSQKQKQSSKTNSKPKSKSKKNNLASSIQLDKQKAANKYSKRFFIQALPPICEQWLGNIYNVYLAFQSQEIWILQNNQSLILGMSFTAQINSLKKNRQFELIFQKQRKLQQLAQKLKQRKERYANNIMQEMQCQSINSQSQFRRYHEENQFSQIDSSNIFDQTQRLNKEVGELKQQISLRYKKFDQEMNDMKKVQRIYDFQLRKLNQLKAKTQTYKKAQTYKFSIQQKNQRIFVSKEGKVAQGSTLGGLKVIFIDPTNFSLQNERQNNIYQINFKINKLVYYIAVGVCQKSIVKNANFDFDLKNKVQHGTYILDCQGFIDQSFNRDRQGIKYQNLHFTEQDTLRVFFYSKQKIAKIIKNDNENDAVNIQVNPATQLEDICFCAYITSRGDQVEIIDNAIRNQKRTNSNRKQH